MKIEQMKVSRILQVFYKDKKAKILKMKKEWIKEQNNDKIKQNNGIGLRKIPLQLKYSTIGLSIHWKSLNNSKYVLIQYFTYTRSTIVFLIH